VQIIKAILLLFGATVIAMLVLLQFNFDLNLFFNEATNLLSHRLVPLRNNE
jgi:cation/acetate symporter